jgi:hypothetical protein
MSSLYLTRLKDCYDRHRYLTVGTTSDSYWQQGTRTRLPYYSRQTLVTRIFNEQEYKGFQIVTVHNRYEIRAINDLSGNPSANHIADDEIGSISDHAEFSDQFVSYVWEIGTDFDSVANLNWATQFCVASGFLDKTEARSVKKAQKKLDHLALVKLAKDDLIKIADERLSINNAENPFNVVIDDELFFRAFGRLRKGKVLATTGNRFVIGYVTPSNHTELKYKTLNQADLWKPL